MNVYYVTNTFLFSTTYTSLTHPIHNSHTPPRKIEIVYVYNTKYRHKPETRTHQDHNQNQIQDITKQCQHSLQRYLLWLEHSQFYSQSCIAVLMQTRKIRTRDK